MGKDRKWKQTKVGEGEEKSVGYPIGALGAFGEGSSPCEEGNMGMKLVEVLLSQVRSKFVLDLHISSVSVATHLLFRHTRDVYMLRRTV